MTTFFTDLLDNFAPFCKMVEDVQTGVSPLCVTGLSGVHKAHFTLGLFQKLEKNILLLVDDDAAGMRICEDINSLAGEEISGFFPIRDYVFRPIEGVSKEIERVRLSVLSKLCCGSLKIVVAPVEAAVLFTIPKNSLEEHTKILSEGDEIPIQLLAQQLQEAGYVRRDFVDGICQYSQRGGILDVFSPGSTAPVRIEFWDDEIDTITYFDPEDQRRGERAKKITLMPAAEVLTGNNESFLEKLEDLRKKAKGKNREEILKKLDHDIEAVHSGIDVSAVDRYIPILYEKPAVLSDYFTDGIVCFSEYFQCLQRARGVEKQLVEDCRILFDEGFLFGPLKEFSKPVAVFNEEIQKSGCIIMDSFVRSVGELKLSDLISIDAITSSPWGGELALLKEELNYHLQKKQAVVLMAGTEKNARVVADDLSQDGYSAYFAQHPTAIQPGTVTVIGGVVSSGFEYPEIGLAVISHMRQTGKIGVRRKKVSSKERISSLDDLHRGDYIVHVTHGIGRYEGIQKLELHGVTKDYIKIQYSGADVLYVPVTQLDLVSRYIGNGEDGTVKLSKMGSPAWQNTKKRVRKAVDDMAKELLDLYAKRQETKGYAFPEDDEWQRDFESRFPYEETSDQLRCIDEIKSDMMKAHPMDRLLCGDVGFGKTEVALRAAFKCVMGGKQCAVLVPTTILAWQHYTVFKKRLEAFPISVELMSRFRTAKEQKKTLEGLANKTVDIVIGTHRLIQKDVKIADLGLVIIDEEQRFGVAHKERFKSAFLGVDVLTLSATPIPRTLNMAMSGIRDMSVIEEPPIDRFPVQTYVLEYSKEIVYEAIRRELRRSGQVFYLHNRVESIEQTAVQLQQDFPNSVVAFAHGKMKEEELSEIWRKLVENEIDILVCTSIIETGVDVPNCNTLIVENADYLGLAQLYQLRGRVGRSSRRAYAYFTFRRGRVLTEIAAKRLSAIREFTKFGSGFKIAMRDLEIRGAGSVLGSSQHGHMEAVGYDLYFKMLEESVGALKGERPSAFNTECLVDIMMDAHIPENYIDSPGLRIDMYRKIASIHTKEDRTDVLDELIDRFGEPPQGVLGLLDVALLRGKAASLGISEIKQINGSLRFSIQNVDMEQMARLAGTLSGRFTLTPSAAPYFTVSLSPRQKPLQEISRILSLMESGQEDDSLL